MLKARAIGRAVGFGTTQPSRPRMSAPLSVRIVRWLYAQARTAASAPVALGPDKARASRRARPVNVYAAVRVTTGRLRQVSGSHTSDIGNPHDRESTRSTHARHTIRRVQHRTHVILMPQPRKILLSRQTNGTAAMIVGHQQKD